LPGTGFALSRFIFGTASLFNAGSRADRLHLLDRAYERGFSHFDTAPYYGFGAAERDLRPLLAAHLDVTITTKVGLYSPGGEGQPDAMIFARKAAGRLLPDLSRPRVDWSVARARASLDASLRRLGRDRADLYMLHEPDPALLAADEWLRWLEREIADGRVRHFGIAVDDKRLAPMLDKAPALAPVVQAIDSIADREADILARYGRPLQITYGYVSHALRRDRNADALAVLGQALARNPEGAIIVSTRQPDRLGHYADLLAAEAR
jgi:D-threo-aldose 1-dehydrogenase